MLSITKLQNLKAIHNTRNIRYLVVHDVINHKTTKFESNSQLDMSFKVINHSCYQSQNYKIWKQFTTTRQRQVQQPRLLSIAKLQNLKAIHNLSCCFLARFFVVINRKTTKFESNSQHEMVGFTHSDSCYQSQNYKIWKQFTT